MSVCFPAVLLDPYLGLMIHDDYFLQPVYFAQGHVMKYAVLNHFFNERRMEIQSAAMHVPMV